MHVGGPSCLSTHSIASFAAGETGWPCWLGSTERVDDSQSEARHKLRLQNKLNFSLRFFFKKMDFDYK